MALDVVVAMVKVLDKEAEIVPVAMVPVVVACVAVV